MSYGKLDDGVILRISYRRFLACITFLPVGGFMFCVLYALYSDFALATNTLCKGLLIQNYIPSFSAATGNFELATGVWRFAVAFQALPRLQFAYMYYVHLGRVIRRGLHWVILLIFILESLENIGLLGLSFFSSKDNFRVHELSFYIFLGSSILHMTFLNCVQSFGRIARPIGREAKAHGIRWRVYFLIIIGACLMKYLYQRHEERCEEGVYSLFALTEYAVIFLNVTFHFTAYFDFYGTEMEIR